MRAEAGAARSARSPGRASEGEPGDCTAGNDCGKLRKTTMIWPMAKESGWEQERPEDETPEMTAGSWEKQGIVRDTGGDR